MRVVPYEPNMLQSWDGFVSRAKNGTFLFFRDYMEYHADRFTDNSLIFLENDEIVAIFPANRTDTTVYSHQGLTYGGVVSDPKMTTGLMLSAFSTLLQHLGDTNVKRLVYKAVPHIYHAVPSEEDLYALHRHDGSLCKRDISSCIRRNDPPRFSKLRRRQINRAKKNGLSVDRSSDFMSFMEIQSRLLRSKFGVEPVHTWQELALLAKRFPDNIKLFVANKQERMLGGVVVYESDCVAHAQYICASDEGKELGATDLLFEFLINDYYAHKRWFDFGISTTGEGRVLNEGLIGNKESYGARAVVYDTYELVL